MARLSLAAFFTLFVVVAHAAPATWLEIARPGCGPIPLPPTPITCDPPYVPIYQLGEPISITVSAGGSDGWRATGYTGTVVFTSSDGSALLPPPHQFTLTDAGVFVATVTFNSLGSRPGDFVGSRLQTITVTDPLNRLSATAEFNLQGNQVPPPIPTLAQSSLTGLVLCLGLVGLVALRRAGISALAPDSQRRRRRAAKS